MSTLSTIVSLLAQAAGWLFICAACVVAIALIFWISLCIGANYIDKLRATLELQARRTVGEDIARCTDWIRPGDDAALVLKAASNLLRGDYKLDGGQLKAEYTKCKLEWR